MKRIIMAALCAIALGSVGSSFGAERMLSLKIGMSWPQALLSTAIPSGDAEVDYGIIVDKKIAFGIATNFLWNVRSKDMVDTSGHYLTISSQKAFMFPIMGFFQVDPVPFLIVHPVLHFNIGYNSMIYSYVKKDSSGTTPLSPYFYGLIVKAGADALYDIGARSSLFLGLEFRWAGMETASTARGFFDKRDMGGIGLYGGFRVLL